MATLSEQQALRAPQSIGVKSTGFEPGRAIPREHTGRGDDVSPDLEWTGVPEGAQSIALVMDDPDAPGGTFTHWTVWDLPGSTRALARGVDVVQLGARIGLHDGGGVGYMGPDPPSGTHRYYFRVFALSKRLGLPAGAPPAEVWKAIAPNVLAWGELMGTFTRP